MICGSSVGKELGGRGIVEGWWSWHGGDKRERERDWWSRRRASAVVVAREKERGTGSHDKVEC